MTNRTTLIVTILMLPILVSVPVVRTSAAQPTNDIVRGLIWTTWGGPKNDRGTSVAADGSGNMYLVGGTDSFGSGSEDALLIKHDPDGRFLWARTWGGIRADEAKGVEVDRDGYIYVTGNTESFGNSSHAFLLKYDPSGNLLWQRIWGGQTDVHGQGVTVDSHGGIYITGDTVGFGTSKTDLFVIKFDSNASLDWQKTWDGVDPSGGEGIVSDPSGNLYVTGFMLTPSGTQTGLLLKLNSTGNLQWGQSWNSTGRDLGSAIAIDQGSNAYVTGVSNLGRGLDIPLLKFNSNGSVAWQDAIGSNQSDSGTGIAVDSQGDVFLSGFTNVYHPSQVCAPSPCPSYVTPDAFLLEVNFSGKLVSNPIRIFEDNAILGVKMDHNDNLIAAGESFSDYLWPEISYSNNYTLATTTFRLQTLNGQIGTLTLPTYSPPATVSIPAGRELPYFETNDTLLLKRLAHPGNYTVKVGGGGALSQGFLYLNQTENVTEGTYIARILLSEHVTGFEWNATGGIRVMVPAYAVTPVTVTGSGTLNAVVYCCDYDQYQYRPHPSFPSNIFLVLTLISWPALIIRRRSRRQ